MEGKKISELKYLNCHCHIINFKFVPDVFFKSYLPVSEPVIRNRATRTFARLALSLLPGRKFKKADLLLDMGVESIDFVADYYLNEMNRTGILLATPLMMDLEPGATQKPEIPYVYQIELISRINARMGGRLMPFVSVDPRRENMMDLIKVALNELGFLGIKIYPAQGYCIDPDAFFNKRYDIKDKMHQLFEYAQENQIPMTAHCSRGSAYSYELLGNRELSDELAHPKHVASLLKKYPSLRLNIAHMGGDIDVMMGIRKQIPREKGTNWTEKVIELMKLYPNVYGDLAYHDFAIDEGSYERYGEKFGEIFEDDELRSKVIFGTDWPMIGHTWDEKDYVNGMKRAIPDYFDEIAIDNTRTFLFGGKDLPERMKAFYDINDGLNEDVYSMLSE